MDVAIAETIVYSEYKKLEKYNDIGLVRIIKRAKFSKYIFPACLPETYNTDTENAIETGWGKTGYRSKDSNILIEVDLELYSDDECRQLYVDQSQSSQLRRGIDAQTQFCAGSRTEQKDACQVSTIIIAIITISVAFYQLILIFAGRLGRSDSNQASDTIESLYVHGNRCDFVREAM